MGRNFENRKNAIFKTAAQKTKLYSKYGKLLYVAAKNGVADPDLNPSLRSTIARRRFHRRTRGAAVIAASNTLRWSSVRGRDMGEAPSRVPHPLSSRRLRPPT